MAEDIEKRTQQFIEVRDAIARMKERHEKEIKPLQDIQEVLTGRIRTFMDEHSLENLKTAHGTCYTTTRYTASVQDGEAFMNLVKAGNWDLIERRANSTAVKDWVKEKNELPSGVNLSAIQTLGVRRPTKSKDKPSLDIEPDNPHTE